MAAKEKTLSLRVYLLDHVSKDCVAQWLAEAAEQSGEGLRADITECEPLEAAVWAPFSGLPFLLAGSQSSLEKCFASAGESASRVFEDCAYFWTLCDTTNAVDAAGAIAKAQGRTVELSWNEKYYNYILSALRLLKRYEGLAGLSTWTHRTRNDIDRIANAYQGAFSPVLILGDPGSGKEVVARKLWDAYCAWLQAQQQNAQEVSHKRTHKAAVENHSAETYRFNLAKNNAWIPVACGWFGETLLQDQLFGHERGAYTGADRQQQGLLETAGHGCIFLDDFDVAPPATLGALLRVMSTDWGKEASFSRLGGTERVNTNAWLLFATNADLPAKVVAKEVRPDFIYRFEDRVIHLRPLDVRPADIPQIALRLWQTIWRGHKDPVGLGPTNIELLLSPKIVWPGNIRQLRALLSLAASRKRLTREPLRTLISEILALEGYNRWVGIVLEPEAPVRAPDPALPSCLSETGAAVLCEIFVGLTPSARGKATTDNRVRITNIVEHFSANHSITPGQAKKLNRGSTDTAKRDLRTLSGAGGKPALLESSDKGATYSPVKGMFRKLDADAATAQ